jgi:hypothetical protein
MKKKKQMKSVLTVASIAVVIIIGTLVMWKWEKNQTSVMGNNVNSGYYNASENQCYANLDEAEESLVPDLNEADILYRMQKENVAILYVLCQQQIQGYEFLILENGQYQYMGVRTLVFAGVLGEKPYDWQTTVRADLEYSLEESYQKIIQPGEDYQVLPAWGVSTEESVADISIDGQAVDHVISFVKDQQTYYLWIIEDLKTPNDANNVVIVQEG